MRLDRKLRIGWASFSLPELQTWALVLFGFGSAVLLGRLAASGSTMALLLPLVPVAIGVALRPDLGMYLVFPVIQFVPYDFARLEGFPLFNSPIDILVTTVVLFCLARFVLLRKNLSPSPLYIPLFLSFLILAVAVVTHHGPDAGQRLYRFFQGLVPLVLALTLVERPRQARNLLASAVGTICLSVILVLPVLLAFATKEGGASSLLRYNVAGRADEFAALAVSVLPIGGISITWRVLMVLPIVFSLALSASSARLRRLCSWFTLALVAYSLLSLYLATAIATGIALLAVLWFTGVRPLSRQRIVLILVLMVFLVGILGFTALGATLQANLEKRVYVELPNQEGRIGAVVDGIRLALENPISGIGAYTQTYILPDGSVAPGHSAFISFAYEYGLFYLLVIIWLLGAVGYEYWTLLRQPLSTDERAVIVGFVGALIVLVSISFVTSAFGNPWVDNHLWLQAGLAVVWKAWRRKKADARLLE